MILRVGQWLELPTGVRKVIATTSAGISYEVGSAHDKLNTTLLHRRGHDKIFIWIFTNCLQNILECSLKTLRCHLVELNQ